MAELSDLFNFMNGYFPENKTKLHRCHLHLAEINGKMLNGFYTVCRLLYIFI